MKKKTQSNQPLTRRAPQQERARQKIELIFEATTRLLERSEPADISTNAIARLSGISIGTLYQYFPDKDAVFKALLSRELHGLTERIWDTVQAPAPRPGGRVADVIGAVLDAYGGRKLAHGRLMQYSLERGSTGLLGLLLERLTNSISQKGVAGNGADIPALSHADAFVLTHAMAGVMRAAIREHGSGAPDRRALEQSLTRLVMSFAVR